MMMINNQTKFREIHRYNTCVHFYLGKQSKVPTTRTPMLFNW